MGVFDCSGLAWLARLQLVFKGVGKGFRSKALRGLDLDSPTMSWEAAIGTWLTGDIGSFGYACLVTGEHSCLPQTTSL
jgi:hypothetical protein